MCALPLYFNFVYDENWNSDKWKYDLSWGRNVYVRDLLCEAVSEVLCELLWN